MVLWIKKNKLYLVASLGFTIIFLFPYLLRDFVNIEHDTFFHLSRIEGYANALSHGQFFPSLYPYKNGGFGYASGLFYCDVLLCIPALLYIMKVPLSICYVITIFEFTYFSCLTMFLLLKRLTKNPLIQLVVCYGYVFANYHITNVYVRGALGEVTAMIFLPMIVMGLYDLFEKEEKNHIYLFGVTGLAISHNLSFLFGILLVISFSILYLKKLKKEILIYLFKETGWAFLFTLFFTLPMIEQTRFQTMYLHYDGLYSNLASYSIPLWKYFANETVFGYGDRFYSKDLCMLVNIGYFLTFIPLTYLFVAKDKKTFFGDCCFYMGYFLYVFASFLIPWQFLSFLGIIQFPWRLSGIAMVLLCIPSVIGLQELKVNKKEILCMVLLFVLGIESVYHLAPVLTRTFGITSHTSYENLLDGSIVDPYYSATYIRVECAGADYLPVTSPDFREYSKSIKDNQYNDLDIPYEKDYTTLSFKVEEDYLNEELLLPLTSYKGYQVYYEDQPIETLVSNNGMISFIPKEKGNYQCIYKGTFLQHSTHLISLLSLILFVFLNRKLASK